RQTIPNPSDYIADYTMKAANLSSGDIFITTRLSEINCENNPDWNIQAKFIIIDLQGNIIQEYETNPMDNISILSACPSQDGGVFVAGSRVYQFPSQAGSVPFRCASNPYLAKFDSNLNLIWETEVSTDLPWYSQWWACQELSNGEILVAGEKYFGDQSEPIEGIIPISANLSKFSPTGDSIWFREIRPEWDNTFYNVMMKFTGLEVSEEGSIFLSGYLWDTPPWSPTEGQYGWLVKTDSLGCIEPGCHLSTSIENPIEVFQENSIHIFPNPASTQIQIQWEKPVEGNLHIFDVTGKRLFSERIVSHENEIAINTQNFPNGLYAVLFESKNQKSVRRFVVSH
ncbi:MAG: T9SS type A sorting domain-containing protein, partial [Bacteroidota bacterium]